MKEDKNIINDKSASIFNKIAIFISNTIFKGNKGNDNDKIINDFKSMLENNSSNELDNRVYEIYDMIKDKYINK